MRYCSYACRRTLCYLLIFFSRSTNILTCHFAYLRFFVDRPMGSADFGSRPMEVRGNDTCHFQGRFLVATCRFPTRSTGSNVSLSSQLSISCHFFSRSTNLNRIFAVFPRRTNGVDGFRLSSNGSSRYRYRGYNDDFFRPQVIDGFLDACLTTGRLIDTFLTTVRLID